MCHMSGVRCHVSGVTCQVSGVTCHIYIHFFFICIFFWQSGGAIRWRVCYQRGVPRLVFTPPPLLSTIVSKLTKSLSLPSHCLLLFVMHLQPHSQLVWSNHLHIQPQHNPCVVVDLLGPIAFQHHMKHTNFLLSYILFIKDNFILIVGCPNLETRREESVEEGIYTGITVGEHMGPNL